MGGKGLSGLGKSEWEWLMPGVHQRRLQSEACVSKFTPNLKARLNNSQINKRKDERWVNVWTWNKLWIQISKYKHDNVKNNDNGNNKATWNRNELTICGVTKTGSKNSQTKVHGACKNQRNDCPRWDQLVNKKSTKNNAYTGYRRYLNLK